MGFNVIFFIVLLAVHTDGINLALNISLSDIPEQYQAIVTEDFITYYNQLNTTERTDISTIDYTNQTMEDYVIAFYYPTPFEFFATLAGVYTYTFNLLETEFDSADTFQFINSLSTRIFQFINAIVHGSRGSELDFGQRDADALLIVIQALLPTVQAEVLLYTPFPNPNINISASVVRTQAAFIGALSGAQTGLPPPIIDNSPLNYSVDVPPAIAPLIPSSLVDSINMIGSLANKTVKDPTIATANYSDPASMTKLRQDVSSTMALAINSISNNFGNLSSVSSTLTGDVQTVLKNIESLTAQYSVAMLQGQGKDPVYQAVAQALVYTYSQLSNRSQAQIGMVLPTVDSALKVLVNNSQDSAYTVAGNLLSSYWTTTQKRGFLGGYGADSNPNFIFPFLNKSTIPQAFYWMWGDMTPNNSLPTGFPNRYNDMPNNQKARLAEITSRAHMFDTIDQFITAVATIDPNLSYELNVFNAYQAIGMETLEGEPYEFYIEGIMEAYNAMLAVTTGNLLTNSSILDLNNNTQIMQQGIEKVFLNYKPWIGHKLDLAGGNEVGSPQTSFLKQLYDSIANCTTQVLMDIAEDLQGISGKK